MSHTTLETTLYVALREATNVLGHECPHYEGLLDRCDKALRSYVAHGVGATAVRVVGEPIHFCEIPSTALCERDLAADNFALFYSNTTNCFASITCKGCRKKIMETRLGPGGYSEPEEWTIR